MRSNWFDELERRGVKVTPEQRRKIEEKVNSVLSYEPRIGVFGKTGVGKSSLCNALFGQDVCPISDVAACTRNPQEVLLNMGSKCIKLVDVPGAGESTERDKEYAELYTKILPELDLVLWLIKADDRAMASDENFYQNIVKPHIEQGKPFFMVLNQADKIEPFREWNEAAHEPGPRQFQNIHRKIETVAAQFNLPTSKVSKPLTKNSSLLPLESMSKRDSWKLLRIRLLRWLTVLQTQLKPWLMLCAILRTRFFGGGLSDIQVLKRYHWECYLWMMV